MSTFKYSRFYLFLFTSIFFLKICYIYFILSLFLYNILNVKWDILFFYRYLISPAPFVEIEFFLFLSHKSVEHICVGLFLSSLSCSIDLCFYLFTNTIYLLCCVILDGSVSPHLFESSLIYFINILKFSAYQFCMHIS